MRPRLNIQSFGVVVCALVFSGLTAQADAPKGHYANPVGGTVLDNLTKLTWQQTAPTTGGSDGNGNYTWANAKAYCAALPLNGLTGWRLPTAKELASILDLTTPSPPLGGALRQPSRGASTSTSALRIAGKPRLRSTFVAYVDDGFFRLLPPNVQKAASIGRYSASFAERL
jgi:hypothetical protein